MADIVAEGDVRLRFITGIAARDGFAALVRRQLARQSRAQGGLCVPKIRFCNIDDEDHRGRGSRCNSADALNCPMERRIFVEPAMNSRHII